MHVVWAGRGLGAGCSGIGHEGYIKGMLAPVGTAGTWARHGHGDTGMGMCIAEGYILRAWSMWNVRGHDGHGPMGGALTRALLTLYGHAAHAQFPFSVVAEAHRISNLVSSYGPVGAIKAKAGGGRRGRRGSQVYEVGHKVMGTRAMCMCIRHMSMGMCIWHEASATQRTDACSPTPMPMPMPMATCACTLHMHSMPRRPAAQVDHAHARTTMPATCTCPCTTMPACPCP